MPFSQHLNPRDSIAYSEGLLAGLSFPPEQLREAIAGVTKEQIVHPIESLACSPRTFDLLQRDSLQRPKQLSNIQINQGPLLGLKEFNNGLKLKYKEIFARV